MKDTFGREIDYLRLSVTENCNFNCRYCKPESCSQGSFQSGIKAVDSEDLFELVSSFSKVGIRKLRLTGGEPLLSRDLERLISRVKAQTQIKEVSLTTNGFFLEQRASGLKASGLDRINVSLDSLNSEKFAQITGGFSLTQVLRGIYKAKRVGLLPLKINVVLMKGINDGEIKEFIHFAQVENVEVRFIELMPIGPMVEFAKSHYLSTEAVLEAEPRLKRVMVEGDKSVARLYETPSSKGRIGLIQPMSCKFCEACNRLRVTSAGVLRTCLHLDQEWPLKEALKNQELFTAVVEKAIEQKPREHALNHEVFIPSGMFKIGG